MNEMVLKPLIVVGGHPAVGKSEISRVVGPMFRNVEMVEFRHLLREVADERKLKLISLSSDEQESLAERVREKIDELREKSVVVLLTHFVHPEKTKVNTAKKVITDYSCWSSHIRNFDAAAYVHLDAKTEELIERAKNRKQYRGIGEHFLGLPEKEAKRLVDRRRLAEGIEARRLSRDRGADLYVVPVNLDRISDAQKAFFRIINRHGGIPEPFWASAFSPKKRKEGPKYY